MIEIPLTQGKVALVDDEDAPSVLAQGRWYAHREGRVFYAVRKARRPDGSQADVKMHAFISGRAHMDHVNGDGLDNRRANLRPATHAENMRNRRRHLNNTSGYIGVYWHKGKGRWYASLKVHGRSLFVGTYTDIEEAARARDAAALEHHGEFARLNFPSPTRGVAHHTSER